MLTLYAMTIGLGAALLFVVQPLFARMVLPLLGGSPAVWNTSMLFFQAALLAGYSYAHLTSKWLHARVQVIVHLLLLLAPLVVLPLTIPAGWAPPTDRNPIPWLLTTMAFTVGLPFFVVSATSPLLQRWFTRSGHAAGGDPYFLYSASNLGSLAALVAYPTVLEVHLRLEQQRYWWTIGYVVVAALVALLALILWKNASRPIAAAASRVIEPIRARRRVRWVLLAFAPSSLMLSVTNYLSMDLAALPLLWVIPLAIYLSTFSLTFARQPMMQHERMVGLFRVFAVLVVMTLAMQARGPIVFLMALHLAGLFAAGMMCHGELAQDRPQSESLTEFYLWISVGGVLGGVFNALVAPVSFSSVAEYPLGLVIACLLQPRDAQMASVKRRRWGSLAAPIALGVLAAGLAWATHRFASGGVGKQARLLAFVVPVLICYGQRRDPLHFGLGLGAILLGVSVGMAENRGILFVERTFFGIHRVVADATGERHTLLHGTTLHGEQNLSSAFRRVAGSYYARTGPLGQTFEAVDPALKNDVAIVGLGAGSVAAYAEAGQRWTFYEIDPTVMRIAGDTRYFTFVADCAATVRIVLGDARLSLMRATNQMFGVIVLDAYNSDAVPLHLITREALALYLQRLQPHGILAFHISNRHLDLETVLGNLARDAGLSCLVQTDGRISGEDEAIGKRPSRWALVARDAADLLTLKIDKRWRTARVQPAARVWTDDYASLFDVVQLHADKRAGP